MAMWRLARWLVAGSVVVVLVAAAGAVAGRFAERRAARVVALESRVLDGSIQFFEAKLAAAPRSSLIGSRLVDLYALRFRATADLDDVARAEHIARTILPSSEQPAAAYARLASVLLTQHRFVEAYDAARKAVAADAKSESALAVFIDAARAVGDYTGADRAVARMDPNTLAAAAPLADRYQGEGREHAARRSLGRLCERLEQTGAYRELRAWCLARRAELEHAAAGPDVARAWLRRALAIHPTHRGATEQLADLAYAQGRWREARRLYLRIAVPAHPDLYLRLAEVERALGRQSQAGAYERRFLTLASARGAEQLNALPLALHLSGKGACDHARRLGKQELAQRHSAEVLEDVAWIEFHCDDNAAAARSLAEAAARAPLTPSGSYLQRLLFRGHDAGAEALAAENSDPTLLEPHALHHLWRQRGDS